VREHRLLTVLAPHQRWSTHRAGVSSVPGGDRCTTSHGPSDVAAVLARALLHVTATPRQTTALTVDHVRRCCRRGDGRIDVFARNERYRPLQSAIGAILVMFACSALWLVAGGQLIESSYYLQPLVDYCGLPRGVATWVVLQRNWDPDRMPWGDSLPFQEYRRFCDETLHPSPRPEIPGAPAH
jgi:hypothetical protein